MNVLIFAPHPDDEILGCGGYMAQCADRGDEVTVVVVTSGHPPIFDDSVAKKNGWPHNLYPEINKSHELLRVKETIFLEYPAAALEDVPRYKFNGRVNEIIQTSKPDIVFIPHFGDMQKDHTLVSEAVMVAVRPRGTHRVNKVYSYECLSETEWNIPHVSNLFIPNTFVDITDVFERKLEAMNCYQSQLAPFPEARSLEAVEALAKLRGSTMGAKRAEAFMLIREYNYNN